MPSSGARRSSWRRGWSRPNPERTRVSNALSVSSKGVLPSHSCAWYRSMWPVRRRRRLASAALMMSWHDSPASLGSFPHGKPHLCRHENLVAILAERLPEDLLRLAVRVHVGGIDQIDAHVRDRDQSGGEPLHIDVPHWTGPASSGETHRAQRDLRDSQTRTTQLTVFNDADTTALQEKNNPPPRRRKRIPLWDTGIDSGRLQHAGERSQDSTARVRSPAGLLFEPPGAHFTRWKRESFTQTEQREVAAVVPVFETVFGLSAGLIRRQLIQTVPRPSARESRIARDDEDCMIFTGVDPLSTPNGTVSPPLCGSKW